MPAPIRTAAFKRTTLGLALAISLGVAGLASAQSNAAGAIHGHAAQGDVVVIENAATGYRREITVGADGGFRAPQTPSGSYRVTLKRADGSPVKDTLCRFKLKKHRFLFGVGMGDAIELRDPACEESQKKFLSERLERLTSVFNYATLPFYWGRFEPEEGFPQTERLLTAARYLRGKGITLKGHPLCWHTVCASWLLQYDNETILSKQLARIRRVMPTVSRERIRS